MKVDADAQLSFARDQVFSAYRDRLTEMVPYLGNINSIVEESRQDEGGLSHVVNIWRSSDADLPKVARSVVKPDMLAWRDHAKWNAEEWTCEWRVEHLAFGQAVDCAGKNRFIDRGDSCTVEIRGHLNVDAKHMPGVPRLLAGTVGPVIERFIVESIKANLVKTADGVASYLEARR
ncbi:MAG: DUF2505 family protein [Myxococcota bacterium]